MPLTRWPEPLIGVVLLVLSFASPVHAKSGNSWRAIRTKAREVRGLVRNKQHQKYKKWVSRLESKDPQFAMALERTGLAASHIDTETRLSSHLKQLRVLTRVWRHVERDGLKEIIGTHYLRKNERWKEATDLVRGFFSSAGSALDPATPAAVRPGVERALASLSRGLKSLRRAGVSEKATIAVERLARKKLASYARETRNRFPRSFPHAPGSGQWWKSLSRYAQVRSQSYDRFKPIVDGPQWRKETSRFIARSKDFLHISSFHWHYDRSGYWLARQIYARKLGIDPKVLEKRLKTESLTQIRDSWIVERLAAKTGRKPEDVRQSVKNAEEHWKRAQVAWLADSPIEVRVLLPSLIQGVERAKQLVRGITKPGERAKSDLLADLESVGVDVIRHHKVLQPQFPYLHLHNLGAVVPHAKMMVSRDEAMVGGLNIGNDYMQKRRKGLVWHDMAVRLRGKAVHDLNWSFVRHWNVARKEEVLPGGTIDTERKKKESGSFYFPDFNRRSRGRAVVVGTNALSSSDKARYTHRTALMLALASAKKNFRMVVPYLTSPVVVDQLIRTARRFKENGVDPGKIEIMLTGYNDHLSTSTAVTADLLYRLQQAGIKVLLWKPEGAKKSEYKRKALHHAKAFTVDNAVAYIGSANAMVRSLVQDWEVGVMTDRKDVVKHVNRVLFDRDLQHCVPFVPPTAWKRKLGGAVNTLLGPILRVQ